MQPGFPFRLSNLDTTTEKLSIYLLGNSFSIAMKKHTAVVLTSTTIDKLNKEELEAIMAHELGHIKNSNFLR